MIPVITIMPTLPYDQMLAAVCLWREGRGEGDEGMRAIYHVILNRVKDPRWPNRIEAVILQPAQFSCMNLGDKNSIVWPMQRKPGDWQAFLKAVEIVRNPGPDPTGGANHYEALPDDREPGWARDVPPVVVIGKHEFYKL